MAETKGQHSDELIEEINNMRSDHRDSRTWGRLGDTARIMTGYVLVFTFALTAIGGLALVSVV